MSGLHKHGVTPAMNDLRVTNWLLLWIALMVFNKFYPDTARDYWYLAFGIWIVWIIYTSVKSWKRDRAERQQEQAQLATHNNFMSELSGIRKKYDPRHEWNEVTRLPEAYSREVEQLRSKYGIVD
jgi:hypothetical protein